MKLILGLIILLLITSGLYFYFIGINSQTGEINNDEELSFADLTTLRKNVEVDGALVEKVKVREGSRIKVLEMGRALLESPNGNTTILDRNTELVVTIYENEGNKTSLSLVVGDLFAQVQKVFEKGEFYEIKTQNALAVVRGTEFKVSYQNGVTSLMVEKGEVKFFAVDPVTGKVKKDTEINVKAGDKAQVADDGRVKLFSEPNIVKPVVPATTTNAIQQTDVLKTVEDNQSFGDQLIR